MYAKMLKHINGRVPVMVGVGKHTALKEVQELTSMQKSMRERTVFSVVKPILLEARLTSNYTDIFPAWRTHTNLQVFIYNIPLLTGQNLSIELD